MPKSIGTIFVELDIDKTKYTKSQQAILQSAKSTSLDVEKNWKILGEKSDIMYNAMRQSAINAYDMIKNRAGSSAAEIIRAEQAKNAKLKEMNEKQFGHQTSLISSLRNYWLAASAAAIGFFYSLRQVASSVNDIERLSKVAGITTTEFQKMSYAAKMTDVESGELATGIKKLSTAMEESSRNTGEASKWFKAMNISVTDADGRLKSLNKIMLEIADQFARWEDGPKKIAIAIDIFGRSGERLVPYLNQGSEGIKKFYEEAEKLGIILDEKLIKKGSELEDRLKKAEAWWKSLWNTIVIGGYEAITTIERYRAAHQNLMKDLASGKLWRDIFFKKPEEWPSESRFKLPVPGKITPPSIAAEGKAGKTKSAYDEFLESYAIFWEERENLMNEAFKIEAENEKRAIEQTEQIRKTNQEGLLESVRIFFDDRDELIYEAYRIEIEREQETAKQVEEIRKTNQEGLLESLRIFLDEREALINEAQRIETENMKREEDERLREGVEHARLLHEGWIEEYTRVSDWEKAWDGVVDTISSSSEAGFFDLFKKGEDKWKAFCDNIVDSFARALSKMATNLILFNNLQGEYTKGKGLLGWVGALLGSVSGLFSPSTAGATSTYSAGEMNQMMWLQHGGTFWADKPTPMIVGEGSEPEFVSVTPKSKMSAAQSISVGPIEIHMEKEQGINPAHLKTYVENLLVEGLKKYS